MRQSAVVDRQQPCCQQELQKPPGVISRRLGVGTVWKWLLERVNRVPTGGDGVRFSYSISIAASVPKSPADNF